MLLQGGLMNKFWQVSSDQDQMSLVGGSTSLTSRGGSRERWVPTMWPIPWHIWYYLFSPVNGQIDACGNITFPQLRLHAVTSSQELRNELLSWANELIELVNWTCLRWLCCIIYSVQTYCYENVAGLCQGSNSWNDGLYYNQLLHWSQVINLNHL